MCKRISLHDLAEGGLRRAQALCKIAKHVLARLTRPTILYWERQYTIGNIDAIQLQTAYAAVHAILQGANSSAWRRKNLYHYPPITV